MILKAKVGNLSYSSVIFTSYLIVLTINYIVKNKGGKIHMQIIFLCIISLQIIKHDLSIKHLIFISLQDTAHIFILLQLKPSDWNVSIHENHSKIYSEKTPNLIEKKKSLFNYRDHCVEIVTGWQNHHSVNNRALLPGQT
jgi:hypothetical protein